VLHHLPPLPQIGLGGRKAQFAADDLGEAVLLQHQGYLVQDGDRHVFHDAVGLDVAEIGDFAEYGSVLDGFVAPKDDDVGIDAHALQLFDAVLGGFGLVLSGGLEVGHERHMDVEYVFAAHFVAHLADRLQEGLAFDVAGGSADLGQNDLGRGFTAHVIDKFFDGVGDVGDVLDGGAQVFAPALPVDDFGEDLARGQVGELVEVLVDEAFVMAQVQVGLRAVLGHVDLAVLIGAHGAGVDVDVGVQLLGGHFETPGLE